MKKKNENFTKMDEIFSENFGKDVQVGYDTFWGKSTIGDVPKAIEYNKNNSYFQFY